MKRVIAHIDHLVLKGFTQVQRQEFAADLQAELGRLLADPALAERLITIGHTSDAEISLQSRTHYAKLEQSGTSAAKSIARGLSR